MPQQMERGKTRLNKGGGNELNTHIAACTPTTWFLWKQPVMCRKHDQKTPKKFIAVLLTELASVGKNYTKMCLQSTQSSLLKCVSWSLLPRCFSEGHTCSVEAPGSENSGLYPTKGGEKKNPLEITMPCCCHGSKWTESSACRATLELLREQSTVAPLQRSIFILLQQSGAFPGRPTTKQSTGNLKI